VETLVTSSHRRRVREIDDGRTVLEEQDLLFTQRKTVWGAEGEARAEGEIAVAKEET
jgi:hypothetical protein